MHARDLAVLLLSLLAGCVASPSPAERASSAERAWSQAADLPTELHTTLLPELRAARAGWQPGVGGVVLWYVEIPDPEDRAALVLLPGRTEPVAKYAEVLHDLRGRGLSLYALDHRGQGLSSRLLDDREAGYVDSFDDYVADLEIFLDEVVGQDRPVYLLAHSMGGAIATLYAMEHPDRLAGLVLVSPMFEIDFGESTESEAYGMAVTMWNGWYAKGQGPYDPTLPFEHNPYTGSLERFEMMKRIVEVEYPTTRLGGPTWGWLGAAIDATREIREHPELLVTPDWA